MEKEGTKGKMLAKKKIFICLLNIYWASIICTTVFWALGVHWWPRTLKFVSLYSCFSNNDRFGKMSSIVDELTNMTHDVTQMTSERHSGDSGVAPRCRWWHHCTWDHVPPHFPSYVLPCARSLDTLFPLPAGSCEGAAVGGTCDRLEGKREAEATVFQGVTGSCWGWRATKGHSCTGCCQGSSSKQPRVWGGRHVSAGHGGGGGGH